MIKTYNIPTQVQDRIDLFTKETGAVLIYLYKSGSHLYGTNTLKSDTDYKGLFIPSSESVLLKQDIPHWKLCSSEDNQKNTKDDIDFQVDSIYKFFTELKNGETGAIDTLFSLFYEDVHVYNNTEYTSILKNKQSSFYNKNLNSFVGYCVGQSKKYGVKGLRYNELKNFNAKFERFQRDISSEKMSMNWPELKTLVQEMNLKYIRFVMAPGPKTQKIDQDIEYLEVLGAKYSPDVELGYVNNLIEKMEAQFGDRTKAAARGTDWKALSHAVRVILEVEELLETGFITFPLPEASYVRDIKTQQEELPDVVAFIDGKLDYVNSLILNTGLPDKSDEALIQELTLSWVRRVK